MRATWQLVPGGLFKVYILKTAHTRRRLTMFVPGKHSCYVPNSGQTGKFPGFISIFDSYAMG